MRKDVIIAIDGGATKTKGILYDLNGVSLAQVIKEGSNLSTDKEHAKKTLEDVIHTLCLNLDDHMTLKHIQLGVAGASTYKNQKEWIQKLEQTYQTKINLDHDALIALYAVEAKEKSQVIMVISGTGSVVMTKSGDVTKIYGGYGHLFGDVGSAYHVGLSLIKHVLYSLEQNIKSNLVVNHFLKTHHLKTRDEVLSFVYHHQKEDIAKSAKDVSDFALRGNQFAKEILMDEAQHIAHEILRVYQTLNEKIYTVISLKGSFVNHAPFVREYIEQSILCKHPMASFETHSKEPVYGAYKLSLQRLQKE